MNDIPESGNASIDDLVAEVVDQFMERVHRGECPRIEDYAERHPEAAELLRQILPALQVLQPPSEEASAKASAEGSAGQGGTLGDFRIQREVGRGGMGVVYEAEQISLGRRVALKVLPFAATLDPRQLQRFHNEARAAASLHHEHIVPVFAVGQERGVHFFAMQFIEGRTMANLITQERHASVAPGANEPTAAPGIPAADTAPIAGTTTAKPRHDAAFFRQVAEWGIQAAEALEHAHSLGIVHRDIKPGNLMIDGHGQLWIADFGLARRAADSDLTMSGDLLGTLRYMSPEQALAKHDLVDHRSDVYSLGATLYELLTLQTAVAGKDRQEILQHLTQTEAVSLRHHDRGIPADLETIVLKTLAKEPDGRYATAKELADDLRRFLASEPVRARRPSLRHRLAKWGQRNRPAVIAATVAAFAVTTVLGAAAGFEYQVEQNRSALEQEKFQDRLDQLTKEMQRHFDVVAKRQQEIHSKLAHPIKVCELLSNIDGWQETLAKARVGWKNAMSLAASNDDVLTEELAQRLQQVDQQLQADEADWKVAKKLDDIRMEEAVWVDGESKVKQAAPIYEQFFRDVGFDWKTSTPAEIAAKIQQARLRYVLVAGLDAWCFNSKDNRVQHAETARLADPDPWRDQVREEKNWNDLRTLEKLAKEVDLGSQSPQIVIRLAGLIQKNRGDATPLLRSALFSYPQDFWLHFNLGNWLQNPDQEIGCFQAALALRPTSMEVHNNLALALRDKKDLDGAIRHFRKAVELDPTNAFAHVNLGKALGDKREFAGALRHLRKAVDLDPNSAGAHRRLGALLCKMKDFRNAMACYQKALDLEPNSARAHDGIGNVLSDQNDLDGAIEHYRIALKQDPSLAFVYSNLGFALQDKKDLKGAIENFQISLKLKPNSAKAHTNMGRALAANSDLKRALFHYEKALELDPDLAMAHNNLGNLLVRKKDIDGAIRHFRKAIDLDANFPLAHYNLARALRAENDLDGAMTHYRKALALDLNYVDAHIGLGALLAVRKDLDGAISYFRKAVELAPSNVNARDNLVGALLEGKNFEVVISYFRETLKLNPDDAYALCHLGCAMKQMGHFAEALNYLRQGHKLGSKQPGWRLPSGFWVEECEFFAKLDAKVPAVLNGEYRTTSPERWLDFLELSEHKAAGIPKESNLAKLPQEQRDAWHKVTSDVRQLRKLALGKFNETSRLSGALTAKKREQVHEVQFHASKTYVIDLESNIFDTFLRLEDAQGLELDKNDDVSPGNLNSRLIFTAQKTGPYRLVATAFDPSGTGPYTLTIREFFK
jgi:tetratricopeptide (TPR) repeat protein/tRNA A-37 threonylcarbamoyl transferase component Bud32